MYKVVLIDDEEWGLASLESSFNWENYGFEVVCRMTDSSLAWDKIQKMKPDVVFCDIRMPGMDGFGLLDCILRSGMKCKCILVSGYAEFQYAREALRRGVYDYLLKPIDSQKTDEFLEKLRQVLDENRRDRDARLIRDTGRLLEQIREARIFENNAAAVMLCIHLGDDVHSRQISEILDGADREGMLFWEDGRQLFAAVRHETEKKKELAKMENALAAAGCCVGVSRPFAIGPGIENAVREAECAACGWFFGQKPGIYRFQPTSQRYFRLYSGKVRMAVAGKKPDQLRHILKEMQKALEEGVLGMDAVDFLVDDIRSALIRKYNLILPNGNDLESMEKILKRFSGLEDLFGLLEKNLVGLLLGTDARAFTCSNEHFRKLLEYVDMHYSEPLQLKSLSEKFFLNMSYCSELFKKVTGKTFSEYLMAARMEAAIEMLQSGTETVSQVAEKTGFGDSYYFSKVFKKYFGVSPNAV